MLASCCLGIELDKLTQREEEREKERERGGEIMEELGTRQQALVPKPETVANVRKALCPEPETLANSLARGP